MAYAVLALCTSLYDPDHVEVRRDMCRKLFLSKDNIKIIAVALALTTRLLNVRYEISKRN
jgi:hypothetical protein